MGKKPVQAPGDVPRLARRAGPEPQEAPATRPRGFFPGAASPRGSVQLGQGGEAFLELTRQIPGLEAESQRSLFALMRQSGLGALGLIMENDFCDSR